ncbi:MAG: hypothetical protein EXR39_12960 [Betaproteobacteria bacterium]|nr:hypothetical protein [Betaproteobacteria bacterium]
MSVSILGGPDMSACAAFDSLYCGLSNGQDFPMRLWYQSLTRPTAWVAYNEALRAVLDAAKDAGTTIEVHGIERRGGIGDQYRYLEFIETGEVLENVERATHEGFDAFLIGNIADPGLREAREITDMPVLGLGELSVHLANMMGGQLRDRDRQREARP